MNVQVKRFFKYGFYLALAGVLTVLVMGLFRRAEANSQIYRPFQSMRSISMGGVRYTQGLYAENFHGNPARVTANPQWRVQLPDVMVETTWATLENLDPLLEGGDIMEAISASSGDNLHTRIQMSFPSVYVPKEKWGFAVGLLSSMQSDISLRNSYRTENQTIADVDLAITVGRKLLEEDRLSVGGTVRYGSRLSSDSGFTIVDFFQGASLSPLKNGAAGAHAELDLGGTYRMPFTLWDFAFDGALSMNNLLTGGTYGMVKYNLEGGSSGKPLKQPRTLSFGMSAKRESIWKFTDLIVALEITELGYTTGGSLFKHIHLGTEAKWSVFRPRLGINQGYLTAGVGMDLKVFTFELATYGEELGKTVGSREDRRVAMRFSFQI
ncbi:MAG: hypothetical protein IT285_04105 [Bdellovibrionales bacterium]|nr:hypothetical protein [Bdellovibrionales bacterium]